MNRILVTMLIALSLSGCHSNTLQETAVIPESYESYPWLWLVESIPEELNDMLGKEYASMRQVDYEHCFFNETDTFKTFYNIYMSDPESIYYVGAWEDIDSCDRDLTVYFRGCSTKQAVWGYKCRPEDFTTDIYKIGPN